MEEKKLLLIVNPVSGRIRISSSLFDIIKVFSDGGFRVTVKMTTARGGATKLVAELGDQPDVVVLCGGDGTLNEGIMGVLSAGLTVPVGYIPCGTTNDFAASLGIERENLKQAALNIVNGKAVPIDIGDFGGMRYFTYIASFGAFTGTSYNVPQVNKNMFGHLAYVMEGLKDLPNIKPIFARVTLDGVSMEDEFIFGSVSNATSIGGMVKIDSDKVDFSDGMFEVMLVRNPQSALEISKVIVAIQTGKYEDCCVSFHHAKDIVFEMPDPAPWALDGEYCPGDTCREIKVLHHAIRIII